MRSIINQASLKKCKIATLLCLGLMLVLTTLQDYSQEILARCPNGYHKSPLGDCEKVSGSNGSPKNVQVGITKMKILVSVRSSGDENTLTQIKSIAKSTGNGNSQNQTDVFTTKELNIFTNRTCQGYSDCFEGTVTKVVDGDTLDINNVRIRLALVNTPETNQDGYLQAKQFVETNCGIGTRAMVDEDDGQKAGSYGRMIGLVFCERLDSSLNKAILTSGNAEVLDSILWCQ